MEKNFEYYMGLPYTRELIPEASGIWFARIKELPNCMSQGNSPEEALRNLDDAMAGWIQGELEDGETIPEPRDEEEYSGRFNTRVPRSLHRKLVEAAGREGVSLNQWINVALAEAVGESLPRKWTALLPGTSSEEGSSVYPEISHQIAERRSNLYHTKADAELVKRYLEAAREFSAAAAAILEQLARSGDES